MMFYTHHLASIGMSLYCSKEAMAKYFGMPSFDKLPVATQGLFIDVTKSPLIVKFFTETIKTYPGIYMLITVNDGLDEAFQEALKAYNLTDKVMYKGEPIQNFNYNTPERLMIFYVMDFRA